MLNKKKILPLFIFVLALVATSSGTIEPPEPWWRGNEGTTFQEWSFSTPDDTPEPDPTVDNPYGQPLLKVDYHPDTPWINDEIPGALGVWALSGEIDIVIPNRPEPNPYKEIWITLRWKATIDEQGGELPYDQFLPDEPLIAITPFDYMDMSLDYEEVDAQLWHKSVYVATIWPNPPKEWITIKGNILVDSLLIETYCVPEPATIAILTIGGLWAIRRRKFKS
ncbi:MAG: PEP-CTERM sorting domain-containing protein [Sedimentisphaerales bacterium]|nr:PEP-CTERM sorting domain-containing protein [Sedimentisphaerales bacterium]